jgi:hypothetical protein
MKIKVPVRVITFVHKDTGKTQSFVGDSSMTSNSFEDTIFGVSCNCTGMWKAISHMQGLGHKVVDTNTEVEIDIN